MIKKHSFAALLILLSISSNALSSGGFSDSHSMSISLKFPAICKAEIVKTERNEENNLVIHTAELCNTPHGHDLELSYSGQKSIEVLYNSEVVELSYPENNTLVSRNGAYHKKNTYTITNAGDDLIITGLKISALKEQ